MLIGIGEVLQQLQQVQHALDALPVPVRRSVVSAVSKLVSKASGGVVRRVLMRLRPSPEDRARRLALNAAIVEALAGHSDLEAAGLALALERDPFAGLLVRVLQHPGDPVDDEAVRDAFAASIYDLEAVGVDPVVLVRNVQQRFLTALRLGPGPEGKRIFTTTRLEQVYLTQGELVAGQERLARRLDSLGEGAAAKIADANPSGDPWEARFAEAKALHARGAVKSALQVWERIRSELSSAAAPTDVRARVHNNIGAVLLELGRADEALAAFRIALDYGPARGDFLANLAQAHLMRGDRAEALRVAERALVAEPQSPVGWAVRIQASEGGVPADDIPDALREAPGILVAQAMAAVRADQQEAIPLLREALRTGPRDPQLLVLLAESIYATLVPRPASDPPPSDVLDEIRRLGAEAEGLLSGTEQTPLLVRALLVQGAAAGLAREDGRGVRYFERALEVGPTDSQARVAAAQTQIEIGNAAAALYLLDGTPADERGAPWHALRALALGLCGRGGEVDADVRAALAGARSRERVLVAHTLADALTHAAKPDLVEPVFALLEEVGPPGLAHVLRARTAARCGDRAVAVQAYETALEAAEPSARAEVTLEFASYLYTEREFERAVQYFETSGMWATNERAAMQYARSAFVTGRYDTTLRVVTLAEAGGEEPWWAVELRARIAEVREDLPAARSALERLVALRPEDDEARIRYAAALLRGGEKVGASEVLAPLEARTDMDAIDTTNLARLLVSAGRAEPALLQAYRALRQYPDDPQVQHACVVGVFFNRGGADAASSELFERTTVVPDTWLKLRADDGEEVDYLILADEPHDVRRNELLATDERARRFLGLTVGDVVTLRGRATNEKAFRVAELKSAMLHTFHDAMLGFQTRFPNAQGLMAIHVGEGEHFDPAPLLRMLAQQQEHGRAVDAMYREKRFPLGAVAKFLGRSLTQTYRRFLYADGPVFVEEPTVEARNASVDAAQQATVVLTVSALSTLRELGRLDLLPALYARRVAPQSLIDELSEEVERWEEAQEHGGFLNAGLTDDHRIAVGELSEETAGVLAAQARELRDAVLAMAEVTPRPLHTQPPARDDARQLVGASSFDAMELAEQGVALYADDWGLRNLARHERGVQGCSTYAVLTVAHERGLLTADECHQLVARLVAFGHTFVPIDVALLYRALVDENFQAAGRVLPLLDVLADPAVSIESAVDVVVGVLRQLALSPLGHGVLAAITSLCLERLTRGRPRTTVVRLFAARATAALRLLPQHRDAVAGRVRAFLATKRSA